MRKLVLVLFLVLVLAATMVYATGVHEYEDDFEYEMEDDFLSEEDAEAAVLAHVLDAAQAATTTPAPAVPTTPQIPPHVNSTTTTTNSTSNSTVPAGDSPMIKEQKAIVHKVREEVKKAHVRQEVWELINKNVNQDKESLISGSFKKSSKELKKGLYTWKHSKTGAYIADELAKAIKTYNTTSLAARKLKRVRGKFYRKFMRVAIREVAKYKDYSLKIMNLYAVSVPLVSASNKALGKVYEELEALWSAIYSDSHDVQGMVGEMLLKLNNGIKGFVLVDGSDALKSIKDNHYAYWRDVTSVQEFQTNVIDKYTPMLEKLGVKKPAKVLYELRLLKLSKYATALANVAKTLRKNVIIVRGKNRHFNSVGSLLTAQLSLQGVNYQIVKAEELKDLKQ